MSQPHAGISVSEETAPTTSSFGVSQHETIPPKVLICGSHPSVESLAKTEYYGHRRNCFWWIAGDALGFRREHPQGPSKEITLLDPDPEFHAAFPTLNFEQQIERLVESGFALWDVVGHCSRKGSLDSDIKNAVPNDVRGWVEAHPSVEKICFSSGGSTADLFLRHNKDWLRDPSWRFTFAEDEVTQAKFKRFLKPQQSRSATTAQPTDPSTKRRTLRLCVMPSVSPAFARMTYAEKRAGWFRECYGLPVPPSSSSSTSSSPEK